MFIEPIQSIQSISELGKKSNVDTSQNKFGFKSVFDNALKDYVEAENKVDEDIYQLSVGETDDLHNLMINTKKAEMSLDLFLQLRNKALDAYNEVMRMGV